MVPGADTDDALAAWGLSEGEVATLRASGAISEQPDADATRRELVALHRDPERRRRLAESARTVCHASKGATERVLLVLREKLRRPAA